MRTGHSRKEEIEYDTLKVIMTKEDNELAENMGNVFIGVGTAQRVMKSRSNLQHGRSSIRQCHDKILKENTESVTK